jgi:hypothetical protein
MKNIKRLSWLFAAIMFAATPISVIAQETSSAIAGTVVDSDGNPVSDATVVIKHTPTGATKTLTTNANGNYQARGLRVGGPYNVSISKDGFGEVNENDLYIKLGEVRDVDATVVSDSVSLDSIQVVGVAQSIIFNADNMGTGTNISRDQLDNMPSIDRSLADFARLDARVSVDDNGGISVAGTNNRYNNFAIDGVATNDEFGLEAGGLPGTISQPFSLDTIEEFSIQVAPYDVALSNFTGANINAVTKSGTNEFTGRISGNYQDEGFLRETYNGRTLTDFTDKRYSVSVGGPIIKDKLFFFLNYEDPSRSVVANFDTSVVPADVQEIIDISNSVYNFDPGSTNPGSDLVQDGKKILAKIDWNINESHRLAVRYNLNEERNPRIRNFGGSRISLSSHWYTDAFDFENYSAILYSDWNMNFSSELRVSTSTAEKNPILNDRLPQVIINTADGDIYFGTERFRQANVLSTDTDNIFFAGSYFKGLHTFKFGFDYKSKDTKNTFVESSLGRYEFDSIADYASGNYSDYRFRIGRDPSNPYPAADWSFSQLGLFAQDTWMVNDRLNLVYGFRYDTPSVDDTPELNQDFVDAFGFRNNHTIDKGVFQPRVGFNLDLSDELQMAVRGGVGLFMGSTPDVWLSNSFTNTGISIAEFRDNDGSEGFTPDPDNQPRPGSGIGGRQGVDAIDPDFKYPTKIRANLALDAELPWYGLVASAEFLYTKNVDDISYKHLNLGAPTGILPDGRNSYYEDPTDPNRRETRANANDIFSDVLFLTNTGKGVSKSLTLSLEKPLSEHVSGKLAYTFTNATDVNSGTSSRAISGWRGRASINPNDDELSTSNYEVENRMVGWLSYENNFFGDTLTKVSLIYTGEDGRPFSYIFDNDANGDGISFNDLFYVPNQDEYVLTNESLRGAFEDFLTSSGLDAYRGQIAPRNAFKQPRRHRFDIRVQQELPSFGFGRATVFFDIKNVGNLLNNDWGAVKFVSFGTADVVNYEGLDDQGRWIYNWRNQRTDHTSTDTLRSRWAAQVGFRFDW